MVLVVTAPEVMLYRMTRPSSGLRGPRGERVSKWQVMPVMKTGNEGFETLS